MKKKLSLYLIISFITLTEGFTQCHTDDWAALKALYESTGGDNWNNSDNWEEIIGNEPTPNCDLAVLHGVNLDENGRVDTLSLPDNLLTGSIPPEIERLSNLAKLSLFRNPLSGSIPPELGNLSNLKELELNSTRLSDSIPSELGNLSNLEYLRLQDNYQFSGSIPPELGNLSNLKELDLWNTSINGSIPSELGDLHNLTNLRLNWNALSGSIPPELGKLSNLKELDLEQNQLSGSIPPELGDLSSLTSLNLTINRLSGSIPAELGKLSNLTSLRLSDNLLEGIIPSELGSLTNLTGLGLAVNQLSGSIPAELGKLNNLEWLGLNNNQLSDIIPSELGNLSKMKNFAFGYNYFSCENMLGIFNLKKQLIYYHSFNAPQYYTLANYNDLNNYVFDTLSVYQNITLSLDFPWDENPDLTYQWKLNGINISGATQKTYTIDTLQIKSTGKYTLHIYNENCLPDESIFELISDPINVSIKGAQCHIDDWIALKALYESTSINESVFNDSWKELTSSEPKDDCILENLYGVYLNENGRVDRLILPNFGIKGSIPAELGKLSKLTFLSLAFNQIGGSIPPELGNLSNLEILYLFNNQLSGSIPADMGKLSNLENLSLSSNQISGNIPKELGSLSNLKFLSIPYNQLSGNIPPELGNLSNLIQMELHKNQLSDSIPAKLGNLSNLAKMDLHDNQLSGKIPAELGDLNTLNFLRLDNNQLSDNIPTEFGKLNSLGYLDLSNNEFSGSIPAELGNLSNLFNVRLAYNYFSCQDILNIFQLNEQINFTYKPQYFTPINYNDIKIQVIDSLTVDQSFSLEIYFPFDTIGLRYEWFHNNDSIPFTTQASLKFDTLQPGNAGKYILRTYSENCLPNGEIFELISDPMYVIIKGYDLFGQPVEYDQIMVQFENPIDTKKYEDEILTPNAGERIKSCNCNRELYLWEFPSTEVAARALIEIDRRLKKTKKKSNIDGGFNNLLKVGNINNTQKAFKVKNESISNNNSDNATIFLLDSGLDYQNSDTLFLLNSAPIDNCYGIESASGYGYNSISNYTIPLSTNFQDDLWHGTYGFRSITADLNENQNVKIVPLKIFDENGQGNLFNLTCALYHAIDHKADVINISGGYSGQPSNILESAIFLAREKEIFITAAAGNDGVNIDSLPHYPAYYASKYFTYDTTDDLGIIRSDSIKFDHVISVVSIDENDKISQFSNFGKQSATLAAYGERIHGDGLGDSVVVASGTSMATYFVAKELALEIASNRNRTYTEIQRDFDQNCLEINNSTKDYTSTGKKLNVQLEEAIIYGCKDPNSCNYFEYVTIEDDSCEYNTCKCVYADWVALKALYENTEGDNWKRNNNWNLFKLNYIPSSCNFENLYGVQLNENGRVTEINLYNNSLTGNIPKELKGLTELKSLYLAANNLDGEIPIEFSELAYLENLILSANNLSGPIPLQLGELTMLKRLYLSYNKLNGEIPIQLHQLNELKYLLLDNNELEGKLPAELALLSNLYLLNISNNQLGACYESDLNLLCDQFWSPHFKGNANMSDGNYFDTEWDSFCSNAEGVCLNNKESDIEVDKLKVYPNPSRGRFVVEILNTDNKSKIFNILNLEGKHVLQIQGSALGDDLFEIDLSEFSKGMYFIEIQTDNNKYLQKLILD